MESLLTEPFIPNDIKFDMKRNRVIILTGPNMAGKSTYMRQIALIQIMAQMGGFVPARSAKLGVVDRVFTRVGAFDDLTRGQSTFMVEMTQVSDILKNATKRSLILLDEKRRLPDFIRVNFVAALADYFAFVTHTGAPFNEVFGYFGLNRLNVENMERLFFASRSSIVLILVTFQT